MEDKDREMYVAIVRQLQAIAPISNKHAGLIAGRILPIVDYVGDEVTDKANVAYDVFWTKLIMTIDVVVDDKD